MGGGGLVASAGPVKKASMLVVIQFKMNMKKKEKKKSRIRESFAPILLLSTPRNNLLNIFVINI